MFEPEVELIVGGRKVSPDALESAILNDVQHDEVTQALRSIRCPEHHRGPDRIEVKVNSLAMLEWTIHGCCERMNEEAKKLFE